MDVPEIGERGMKAVILAAGRGSRLGSMTEANPKGMVEIKDRPLLDWQRRALLAAGVESVTVVTGYKGEVIADYGFSTIENPDWHLGNMISSLDCALREISGPLIISYADILYQAETVRGLLAANDPFAMTYDKNWLSLWQRRFDDPLSDAETFRIDPAGFLLEIGGKTDNVDEIEGQFMGLFKLEAEGRRWIEELLIKDPAARLGLDTTGMISRFLNDGKRIRAVPASGGWCEIDDQEDYAVARALIDEGLIELTANNGGEARQ